MMHALAAATSVPPFFLLLTLVLSSVVVVSLLLSRFRQSLLVGYFLCGLVISNSGVLHTVGITDITLIHSLSELGIVLLLFTIGIEFSMSELKALKRPALLGGGVQVLLTIAVAAGLAICFGIPPHTAVIIGFAACLSSTAVSLKCFQDMEIPESPQARVTLGIAIFQDLAAILFMILVPAIAGSSDQAGSIGLLPALGKGLAFTAVLILFSRYGLPQTLDAVAKTRSRELFTVTVVGLCALVALLSGLLGLSPALGAFAAGVVVSESIYSHRVLSDVLPFKDLFLTIFFVSVGLLIDLKIIFENALTVLLITLAILLLKGCIVFFAARLSKLPHERCFVTAAALCSSGEFSIVVLNRARDFHLFSPLNEQIFLSCTAFGMALVPTLMKHSGLLAKKLRKHHTLAECRWEQEVGMVGKIENLTDHVIICGYGPVGKNLHENLAAMDIPVVILELNHNTVKQLIGRGDFALFADARDREALEAARIRHARGIAITVPSEELAVGTAHLALSIKPDILVYARCKFSTLLHKYRSAGIHHTMLDEEQSGKAMINSVLQSYDRAFDQPFWNEG